MEPKIYFHVYVSSAVTPLNREELMALLEKSRINNAKAGITGMLLEKDGNFMQVVEGPEKAVQDLLIKIESDARHRGFTMLLDGYEDTRQFESWSMGFYNLNSLEARTVEGYSEFLKTPLNAIEFSNNPSACQRLLMSFKKSMR
jgi:hypothetical protein